jgi:hypothetical protein
MEGQLLNDVRDKISHSLEVEAHYHQEKKNFTQKYETLSKEKSKFEELYKILK